MTREEFQKEGVNRWFGLGKKGCIAYATGVGKSKVALDCISKFRASYPFLKIYIVTPTEEMRDRDWILEFQKWNVSTDFVEILCYASLMKTDISDAGMIVTDECHRLTLQQLKKIDKYSKNLALLGLTATYPKLNHFKEDTIQRIQMLNFLFPVIHTVTTDEAVENGYINDFQINTLFIPLDKVLKNTYKTAIRTEAQQYEVLCSRMQAAISSSKEYLIYRAIADRMHFIYNLPSKEKVAADIISKSDNLLVFCGSIHQAESLCGRYVYHSKSKDTWLTRFQNQEIKKLACVKALNEGKNLYFNPDSLIVQVDSQERNLVQRIGRTIRKIANLKSDRKSVINILVSKGTVDEKWYRSCISDMNTSRINEINYEQ